MTSAVMASARRGLVRVDALEHDAQRGPLVLEPIEEDLGVGAMRAAFAHIDLEQRLGRRRERQQQREADEQQAGPDTGRVRARRFGPVPVVAWATKRIPRVAPRAAPHVENMLLSTVHPVAFEPFVRRMPLSLGNDRSARPSILAPSQETSPEMSSKTRFDQHGGILRFRVPVGQKEITAFITDSTWHSHSQWSDSANDLGEFYEQHQGEIDRVVERKVRAGARAPVVVKAGDL